MSLEVSVSDDDGLEHAFDTGIHAGREDMLRRVLAEALVFEAKMRKRRYFNNAAGVRRFAEHLEATFLDRIEAWRDEPS